MAKVKFINGPYEGQELSIPQDGITFGRSKGCSIVIDDNKISREHAAIRIENANWWVYDLQSSNGTKVNDLDVSAYELSEGDTIEVGGLKFMFETEGEDTVSPDTLLSIATDKPVPSSRHKAHTSKQKAVASKDEKMPPKPAAKIETKAEVKPTVSNQDHTSDISDDDVQAVAELNDAYKNMCEQLAKVVIGQKGVIEEVLIAIFCRGHALLVGVPGVAKTLMISTLSHVLDLSFKRIQFTPDLMPSDISGTDVLEENKMTGKREFRFVKGPIFANMVLADEINRTPPKTQASLLEAMQEHRVTVGDQTYHLPEPFFVLATQNPIEQEGTYPLPEAQLDRFLFNIVVDYPTFEEEHAIIRQVSGTHKAELEVAINAQDVLKLQQLVKRVPVADHVIEFACGLVRATRPKTDEAPDFIKELVGWGAGPRAGICLITAAKARAVLYGRFHATTEDVIIMAYPVLRHRVITTFNAEAAGVTSDDVIKRLIDYKRPKESLKV
jgi:MoxR-like ATPase